MRFLFLITFFASPAFLDGMVVADDRVAKRAALAKSFEALDKELKKLSVCTSYKNAKKKQRSRSDAIGSQAEFLKKSLSQCSDIDYSGSDGESHSQRVVSSSLHRRSSSTSD